MERQTEKPVILTVDDEPAVLAAIARDVRQEYGKDYRVMRADGGQAALQLVDQLKLRDQPVALFLVDQRMPGMTGVDFLAEARMRFPDAKRILLTAYADTEAAIKAINDVDLDYYLMKPWDPPEENLYPTVGDFLKDWEGSYVPPFGGIRIVGHANSRPSHEVKDFLARNVVPYQWLDLELDEEARQLLELAGQDRSNLPLVLLPDGTTLVQPTNQELAAKMGLSTHPKAPTYDLVIVGAGPAGLAAAINGASEALSTLLIDRIAMGGQVGTTSRIENYMGFPTGLKGAELTNRAKLQATRLGAEILVPLEVDRLTLNGQDKLIRLTNGMEIHCRALIVASGVAYRRLGARGVERLEGAGIYYGAAVTEAVSARGKAVFIVGAGNSAGQAAVYLSGLFAADRSRFARSVTILVRGDSLEATMSAYLIKQIEAAGTISVRTRTEVVAVDGVETLESVTISCIDSDEQETLAAGALFIFIGAEPHTEWLADTVLRDRYGFILTGPDLYVEGKAPDGWSLERSPFFLESSAPGIFVAGDVRHESVKRASSAMGEGSMAVQFVHRYLAEVAEKS